MENWRRSIRMVGKLLKEWWHKRHYCAICGCEIYPFDHVIINERTLDRMHLRCYNNNRSRYDMKAKLSLEQISMLRTACLLAAKQHKEQADKAHDPELREKLAYKYECYMELYKLL